jgi:predicted NBD/HSP70 family sugar kinase
VARSLAGATQDEVRRHNLGTLVRILHEHGATSRSDLTTRTGLNRSTVGDLTGELVAAGLLRETTPVGRGVGRPSIVVRPNEEHVFVLAFDVGVERTVAALVGLGGKELARREVFRRRGASTPASVLRMISLLGKAALEEAPHGARCVGVGVAVPGVVRHSDGLVRFAPNMGWVDLPFGARVRDSLGTNAPVIVGNDADLGALAEHVRGCAVGAANVVFIAGEVGVGGGIILDGRPMTGAGGYGGELGHMMVNPRGRTCRCGRRGCWETEVGEAAVVAALGGAPDDSIDELIAAVRPNRDGDVPRLRTVGRWLGLGLANLVNLFNPEVIVLGGLLSQVVPYTELQVREGMATALAAPSEQVRLELPALGRDSALFGAAEAAFAPLLDDPLGQFVSTRAHRTG